MISVVCATRGDKPWLIRKLKESVEAQEDEIEFLVQDQGGLSEARNAGIERAHGEIIAFVDDDARLVPGWSRAVLKAFDGDPYGFVSGITGRVSPDFESEKDRLHYPKSLYWIIGCTAPFDVSPYGHGANMAFRREKIGQNRFDIGRGSLTENRKHILGEDSDFQLRVGLMKFASEVEVLHRVPKSRCTRAYARKYAYAQGRAEMKYRQNRNVPKRPGRTWRIVAERTRPLLRAEVLLWGMVGFLEGKLFG